MSTIKDGGQAFPQPVFVSAEGHEHVAYPGMTLRDYFAAKAMQALIGVQVSSMHVASEAYQIADAMLAAREQS